MMLVYVRGLIENTVDFGMVTGIFSALQANSFPYASLSALRQKPLQSVSYPLQPESATLQRVLEAPVERNRRSHPA